MIKPHPRICCALNVLALLLSVLYVSGCASPSPDSNISHANDPERVKAFQERIVYVANEIEKLPNYQRIPLDTPEEQEWFAGIAFQYWDNQTTREEFISTGLKRFPDHRASFETVAEKLK